MKNLDTTKVGKRGTIVIPADLRRKYRLEEGSLVIAEARPEGVLKRPDCSQITAWMPPTPS